MSEPTTLVSLRKCCCAHGGARGGGGGAGPPHGTLAQPAVPRAAQLGTAPLMEHQEQVGPAASHARQEVYEPHEAAPWATATPPAAARSSVSGAAAIAAASAGPLPRAPRYPRTPVAARGGPPRVRRDNRGMQAPGLRTPAWRSSRRTDRCHATPLKPALNLFVHYATRPRRSPAARRRLDLLRLLLQLQVLDRAQLRRAAASPARSSGRGQRACRSASRPRRTPKARGSASSTRPPACP